MDGFHPVNAGNLYLGTPIHVPATPSGCMALLRAYDVDPSGKEAVVKLGAPFHIDFESERTGDAVKIDPTKIRIRGAGGEIYTHLNGAVPEAEVVSSKTDNGKGARPVGELVPIPDTDTLNRIANKVPTLGIQIGYYPIAKGATLLLARKFSGSRFFNWVNGNGATMDAANPTIVSP